MLITSPANPRLKHARRLHERKYRETHQQFLMEGMRIIAQAAEEGIALETLVVADELLTSEFGQQLVVEQQSAGVEVLRVSADLFRQLSLKDGPQGIAAVAWQRWFTLAELHPGAYDLWLALDRIQDPGNLGTILRTTDAAGGRGVVLLGNCTDPYDPTALRASMGAAFSLRLCRAETQAFAAWKQEHQLFCLGTSDKAKVHYRDLHYPPGMVLIMGSEREGMHPELSGLCDATVSIPMAGKNDSLNIGVAAGIVCYEYHEQNRRRFGQEDGH